MLVAIVLACILILLTFWAPAKLLSRRKAAAAAEGIELGEIPKPHAANAAPEMGDTVKDAQDEYGHFQAGDGAGYPARRGWTEEGIALPMPPPAYGRKVIDGHLGVDSMVPVAGVEMV